MYLIDKKGIRPVCVSCKKAAKEYGVVVPEGKAFVCGLCRAAMRRPVVRPRLTARGRKYAERPYADAV